MQLDDLPSYLSSHGLKLCNLFQFSARRPDGIPLEREASIHHQWFASVQKGDYGVVTGNGTSPTEAVFDAVLRMSQVKTKVLPPPVSLTRGPTADLDLDALAAELGL